MARNKYIYHHFVDNKEVSKEDFKKALQEHFVRCDTNYDNPLLNIGYVDYKALERAYNRMKKPNCGGCIYVYDNNPRRTKNCNFRIKRETVV